MTTCQPVARILTGLALGVSLSLVAGQAGAQAGARELEVSLARTSLLEAIGASRQGLGPVADELAGQALAASSLRELRNVAEELTSLTPVLRQLEAAPSPAPASLQLVVGRPSFDDWRRPTLTALRARPRTQGRALAVSPFRGVWLPSPDSD